MRVISDRSALFLGGMLFDVANTRICLVVFKMMSKSTKSRGVNKLCVSKKKVVMNKYRVFYLFVV